MGAVDFARAAADASALLSRSAPLLSRTILEATMNDNNASIALNRREIGQQSISKNWINVLSAEWPVCGYRFRPCIPGDRWIMQGFSATRLWTDNYIRYLPAPKLGHNRLLVATVGISSVQYRPNIGLQSWGPEGVDSKTYTQARSHGLTVHQGSFLNTGLERKSFWDYAGSCARTFARSCGSTEGGLRDIAAWWRAMSCCEESEWREQLGLKRKQLTKRSAPSLDSVQYEKFGSLTRFPVSPGLQRPMTTIYWWQNENKGKNKILLN